MYLSGDWNANTEYRADTNLRAPCRYMTYVGVHIETCSLRRKECNSAL